jgi:uncharacterized protein
MVTVYVTSTETFAGKSALCIGLATQLIRDGFSIGYMKPISRAIRVRAGHPIDEDVQFIKDTFQLPEPLDLLTPIALTSEREKDILSEKEHPDALEQIRDAYERVARGRDIVLLEAGTNLREGYLLGLPAARLADALDARELVVVRGSDNLVDDILAAQDVLGSSMLGVVVNAVPRPQMAYVADVVQPYLERHEIPVLGILPQEQLLLSVSVRELAETLDGEVICCDAGGEGLVEHLMIGAMGADSALAYFRRKPNKAVITGGDRQDIQLAALETSTRCLILTGGLTPSATVLRRAQSVKVPIVLVKHDTLTTMEMIDQLFGKARFHQQKKIQRFAELMQEFFDFGRFYGMVGLHRP